MALTAGQRTVLKAVLGPILRNKIDQSDFDFFVDLFDPDLDADKPYVRMKLQEAKTFLLSEKAGLQAAATARSNTIDNQVAIIDSLLAKFP